MAAKKKDFSNAFGLDVEPENKYSETSIEQKDIDSTKDVEVEQVSTQTITIIQKNEIEEPNEKEFNELEQYYLDELADIREKINNPAPISRLNKRKQDNEDVKRNVTFNLRTDISYVLDNLVDDAKVFKNKFQDEIVMLGIEEYIKKYGVQVRKFR